MVKCNLAVTKMTLTASYADRLEPQKVWCLSKAIPCFVLNTLSAFELSSCGNSLTTSCFELSCIDGGRDDTEVTLKRNPKTDGLRRATH